MEINGDRRRWPRQHFPLPLIGAVLVPSTGPGPSGSNPDPAVFVDLHNLSESGAFVESPRQINSCAVWSLLYQDPMAGEWKSCRVKPVWNRLDSKGRFHAGLEFLSGTGLAADDDCCAPGHFRAADIEFLTGMPLLEAIPRPAFCHLLNCLKQHRFAAGKRIIRQGAAGDSLYILQEGICSVGIEKNGGIYPINRIQRGEMAGEMAVLTGEPRTANVDAETDVVAWKLGKADFERVADRFPDLRSFLTELISNRFESSPFTADRTIGKYLIRRKLGKGGWSIVYEGLHTTLNVPVAIKMMRHDMALEPAFLERFRTEARLIAKLNHRNIVHVFDIEERYRTIFIIMEYLEGQSVEEILRLTGRIEPARALSFIVQICNGLQYAHEQGFVHQDIKPANLFVSPDNRLKILDFGLACSPGSRDVCFLGTVFYTAPEQIHGNAVGPFTDMFALGVTAYEMLTGKRPFPEDDINELLEMHLNTDVPDPAKLVPNLPEALRSFVMKACRRNPKRRYQTAAEALKDLMPLARKLECLEDQVTSERRKMTTLFLIYSEEQQLVVKQLLEKFSQKLESNGVTLKIADFKDV